MKVYSRLYSSFVYRVFSCLVLVLMQGGLLAQSSENAGGGNGGPLRAAVVKVDITPESPKMLLGYNARQSTGVNDAIHHRIVVLDNGITQFCLVSSDICVVSPSEYDHVAAALQRELGIDPLNFWWTLTHTHSAPEVGVPGLPAAFMGERYKHTVDTAYTSFVEKTLIAGIREARKQLVPAKMGVGWGFSQANINRRAIGTDGKAFLGMNPDGPVDRKIGLIRIDKQDGSPLVLLANYAMHGTVLGAENLKISGDAPGIVAEYVEKQMGAPMLYINGAAGNIAPLYSVYPNPGAGHMGQFRVMLGDKILEANKKIKTSTDKVTLLTGAITVNTPRKKNLPWPEDLGNYTTVSKDDNSLVKLPIRFLKINHDVAIWSAPLELFCEISNEIRDRSPFEFTFYYGYTNGWLGYMPTEKEFGHGGYEPSVSPFTPVAGAQLTEAVSAYLRGELSSK
jgi:neutral ceramidase